MERSCWRVAQDTQKEEQAFGYYCNPNAEFDYFQVGGGWHEEFLVREACSTAILGVCDFLSDSFGEKNAPKGYRWVAGARKADIEWDVMRQCCIDKATEQFHKLESCYLSATLPNDLSAIMTEEGIRIGSGLLYRAGESLEEYLRRHGVPSDVGYPVDAWALVNDKGWRSCDEKLDKKPEEWDRELQDFIASTSDETFLVALDCHC